MTGKGGLKIQTSWANVALPDGRRVGIGLDIRERKRSEAALRRAAEHLELAIEAGDEGTWDYDFDNKVFFLGAHSRKILGISPDEPMTDEKFYAIVHPDDRERVRRAVRAVLSPASDGVYNAEFCILRRDGAIRWINARGQVYFQGAGVRKRPARFIGINRDITDRKQAEEILKRDKETFERLVKERSDKLVDAQRELDRSRRLSDIGKLAATIAHELRNPLAAIDLAGASIRRKAQNPSVEKSSENIRKKVGESNRIIDDILYFTRMRAPAFEDVNIYELLRESMKTAKARHPDPRLHVEPDIEPLRGAVIHADADHLREVFANLLNNALEAIPEAEEGLVRVTGSFDGNTLEVSVHDNGAGISAESQERLFEPFFSTKKKGTGLGLSVVSQIVKMHKGTITVDSEPGKGTTMTVRIPRNPEELS
jgi:PAS domain S-box-containing protein